MSFRFKVGQFVTIASAEVAMGLNNKHVSAPILQIIERQSQECPGGTQYYYITRSFFINDKDAIHFEIELSEIPDISILSTIPADEII